MSFFMSSTRGAKINVSLNYYYSKRQILIEPFRFSCARLLDCLLNRWLESYSNSGALVDILCIACVSAPVLFSVEEQSLIG